MKSLQVLSSVLLLVNNVCLPLGESIAWQPIKSLHWVPRGGSTQVEQEESPERAQRRRALEKYRVDQQFLLQVRATLLTELLARRGLPVITMETVSTPEGTKPPEVVDWDCAMSTENEPKTCLYSFDAEPMTKVLAPIHSDQWISLSALNRLRRTDPTKVEPMWHSQYNILQGWFGSHSPYSLGHHVGMTGLILSLLLDRAIVLRTMMGFTLALLALVCLPVLEWAVHKCLISAAFWNQWPTWGRIAHAALPLKLLLAQMAYKSLARVLSSLEMKVRDVLVDMESTLLEETLPLTVGPGSETIKVKGFDDFDGLVEDDVEFNDMEVEFNDMEVEDDSFDGEYDDDEY